MATGTTNHDEIRRWAESKGGKPAAVKRTHQGGDVGIIRIMFPDNPQSSHDALVEISWDEFFEQFEGSGLALLYEEDSLFSKIIGRDTMEKREHGEHASRHHPQGRGSDRDTGSGARAREAQTASGGHGGESSSGKPSGKGGGDDLSAREYRDADGNVHHHTKAYMEQHGGKR
ncbi:MAG: hypothetical protein BGO51_28415 [Rhodospirillales bacterium 69-11]|nr:hypothetical protein [Rhodospirillales bacterium]MBN8927178.1 hypothetical protein [Rhodospirillales bacterium]OJW25228.1 MAG: hypothetical protein BGO51_28415 [Rhodospirillales bacterium 69-11]